MFNQVAETDYYRFLAFEIQTKTFKVYIENEMLYQAMVLLPEKRLDILIFSYFLGLDDRAISRKMSLTYGAVRYNKEAALKYLRKIMESEGEE